MRILVIYAFIKKYVLDTTRFEESNVKYQKILCKHLYWNFSDDLRGGILKTTCPVDNDEDDHNDNFHLLLEED